MPRIRALAAIIAALLALPAGAESITGEPLPAEALGAGFVEGWDAVLLREAERPADWDANPRDREPGTKGRWVVPGPRATKHTHSGERHAVNKWGDPAMAIGFPRLARVAGVWLSGQGGPGTWTTGVRAIGYRGEREIGRTDWFRDVDDTPSWFAIDLGPIDRLVFEAEPVWNGAGWYAIDDLAWSWTDGDDADRAIVADFEAVPFDADLARTRYLDLDWIGGLGAFGPTIVPDDAVHAPLAPPEIELGAGDGAPSTLGPGGGGHAAITPVLVDDFQTTIRGDAGSFSYPPDTTGAVGADHLVVAVNRVIAVFDRASGAKLTESTLGSFLPGSNGDPRVVYDPHSDRWIVIVSDFNSRVYLAVSTSSNPMGSWYKTHVVVSQGADAGRWPDYPTLGVNATSIQTAAYMVGGGAQMSIFVIDKAPLLANPPGLGTVTAFRNLPWEGAMQPAVNFDPGDGQSIVSRGSPNTLHLRRLSGPANAPVLDGPFDVAIPFHDNPPDAPALGSATPLDTVGTRPMNAVQRNGVVATAHCVGLDGRAAARWYQVDAAGATLVQSGEIADPVRHYFFPTVALNAAGDMVLGCCGVHAGEYAGAWYAGRRANDPPNQISAPVLLRAGAAPQNNIDNVGRNRWGDYTIVAVDPVDELAFWTMLEYAHANDIWGTHAGMLTVPPGPDNDFCFGAPALVPGTNAVSFAGATGDGPDETAGCGTAIDNDVWYKLQATCAGTITLELCDADFDSVIAVYDGCPDAGAALIACDDDGCGAGSRVTFPTTQGFGYKVRVGTKTGAAGSGTLVVTCTPGVACPADLDESGAVDFGDVVSVLSAWGQSGVAADLDGSGTVDLGDVLVVLSTWGEC